MILVVVNAVCEFLPTLHLILYAKQLSNFFFFTVLQYEFPEDINSTIDCLFSAIMLKTSGRFLLHKDCIVTRKESKRSRDLKCGLRKIGNWSRRVFSRFSIGPEATLLIIPGGGCKVPLFCCAVFTVAFD